MTRTNEEAVKGLLLENTWDLCYRSHAWISFNPENRATQIIKEFSAILKNDLEELGDNKGNYQDKFVLKFQDWMRSKGNCASSVIAGGSGFNVRKAIRANEIERGKADDFFKWREKYFKAVNRIPTKSPEDDLEIAKKRLEELTLFHLEMKELNKEAKKNQELKRDALIVHLKNEGFSDEVTKEVYSFSGEPPFKIQGFTLSNNNAKIKATEKKIKAMESRIERKSRWEDIKFEGGYVTIEDDRLKIFHDEKPSKEIICEIKSKGFRWSPNWSCWCRKHTGNAVYSLRFLSFLKNEESK